MIKAGSLLYSIYICLIVSLLCAGLLWYSGLYSQLNIFYETRSSLYVENQSAINYALIHPEFTVGSLGEDPSIISEFQTKQHGLLQVLTVRSVFQKDTVESAHFLGRYDTENVCLVMSESGRRVLYSGSVILNGYKKVPGGFLGVSYIQNESSNLIMDRPCELAINQLPRMAAINLESENNEQVDLQTTTSDTLDSRSFFQSQKIIQVKGKQLQNQKLRGNYLIKSSDSLFIGRDNFLEDVIISAPKIVFEDGFEGTVQAFASELIVLGREVSLHYPSALCIRSSAKGSQLILGEKSKVSGILASGGYEPRHLEDHTIEMEKDVCVIGDIYCEGKLLLTGKVHGSVYTNRIAAKKPAATYDNMIWNATIDAGKRPSHFVSLLHFDERKGRYGILKKVR